MNIKQKLLIRRFRMDDRISNYQMLQHMRSLKGDDLLEIQQHLRNLKYMSKEPMFQEILNK